MPLIPLKEYPFDKKPMICTHRGDTSHGAMENSITAIDAAIMSGAEMIEIDVQMTSDGVLICHHDDTLEKSDPLPIWKRTYSDLLARSNTDVLPLFEDILRHTTGKIYLNIEMKDYSGYHPSRFVHPLVTLVKKYGMHPYSLYSSFRFDFIQALPWDSLSVIIRPSKTIVDYFNAYALSPVLITDDLDTMTPSQMMKFAHATSYACTFSELRKEFISDIERNKIFLSVYTARTAAEFKEALYAGARAVVTDIPGKLIAYRNEIFQ
jgi:glycerophosphoryl diester phosphodiesterase